MTRPSVSFIVPMRDEATHVAECLESVLAQDYPSDHLEILVVDGGSTDGSREIVHRFQEKYPIIKTFENPKGIFPSAVNIGVRKARGDLVVILSAHCAIARDYTAMCVDRLNVTGADSVGGPIETVGVSFIANAIAFALSTPFGVGNAKFRYSRREEYVDTVAFQCYRRESLVGVGEFNETLVRNSDIEFNSRFRKAGGTILLSPSIRAVYHSRSSLTGLCRQNFSNGEWNIATYLVNPDSLSLRHFVPMFFTIGLLCTGVLVALTPPGKLLLLGILLPYAFLASLFSVWIGLREGPSFGLLMPIVFLLLHLSYGCGSLYGLAEMVVSRGARSPSSS